MIEIHALNKVYPSGHYALRDVNLKIATGELVFLTGHSGSGKSTLLKLLMLSERSYEGSIFVGKRNLKQIPNSLVPQYRQNLGLILQHPNLIKSYNIFTNLALPLILKKASRKEINQLVPAALDRVGLLHKAQAYPDELALGEQQRACIARAIVSSPKVLLADEPTGDLDPALALEIMQLLTDFNSFGCTTLISTHDLSLLKKLPHRIVALQDGQIIG